MGLDDYTLEHYSYKVNKRTYRSFQAVRYAYVCKGVTHSKDS